jgi:hypothetical protein
MAWDVEYTDQFGTWFAALDESEQESVLYVVTLLETEGPALARPYADTIRGSRFANLRELRVQHAGRPYRVLYAFDPRRTAILILGGDKTGDDRWYDRMVPIADDLYAEYLDELRREGLM